MKNSICRSPSNRHTGHNCNWPAVRPNPASVTYFSPTLCEPRSSFSRFAIERTFNTPKLFTTSLTTNNYTSPPLKPTHLHFIHASSLKCTIYTSYKFPVTYWVWSVTASGLLVPWIRRVVLLSWTSRQSLQFCSSGHSGSNPPMNIISHLTFASPSFYGSFSMVNCDHSAVVYTPVPPIPH